MTRALVFGETASLIAQWGAIVALFIGAFTLVGLLWRKVLVPLVHGIDWIQKEMAANGEAHAAGTDGQTLRDAVDRYGIENKELATDLHTLTRLVDRQRERQEQRHEENRERLTNIGKNFEHHLTWSDEVVERLDAAITALERAVTRAEDRIDQLEQVVNPPSP